MCVFIHCINTAYYTYYIHTSLLQATLHHISRNPPMNAYFCDVPELPMLKNILTNMGTQIAHRPKFQRIYIRAHSHIHSTWLHTYERRMFWFGPNKPLRRGFHVKALAHRTFTSFFCPRRMLSKQRYTHARTNTPAVCRSVIKSASPV